MQSTNLTRGQNQWSALDWWPPIGWWPEPARDLLDPGSATASATFVLLPKAESVHSARSFAAGTLAGWDMTDLQDGMELVVSELATNALRHGLVLSAPRAREVIRLSLIRRGELVTCAITDPGSAEPVLRDPSPFEPGGLGLHIVESLSVRWGWCPLAPQGKAVWAVLSG
ncbi:ATP-binding protein [Planotetraspora sp. A-T 1434]|uniref:ATP-binding protein n=1 Tax=Planotetraspora sp. A-T 1434 TaxID=2979219 RepID=UPI0021C0766D|nr:ATP-binding protein [Planotetraspora sp. A-T 1434]MCT9929983.1 ATP-binding protein [Planotetraspora sp. A-T 1434]